MGLKLNHVSKRGHWYNESLRKSHYPHVPWNMFTVCGVRCLITAINEVQHKRVQISWGTLYTHYEILRGSDDSNLQKYVAWLYKDMYTSSCEFKGNLTRTQTSTHKLVLVLHEIYSLYYTRKYETKISLDKKHRFYYDDSSRASACLISSTVRLFVQTLIQITKDTTKALYPHTGDSNAKNVPISWRHRVLISSRPSDAYMRHWYA